MKETGTKIRCDGFGTFWSLQRTSATQLIRELTSAGFNGHLPPERKPFAILRDVVEDYVRQWKRDRANRGRKVLVRPLEHHRGYEVVRESLGTRNNRYAHWFYCHIPDNRGRCETDLPPDDLNIDQEYATARGFYSPAQVTRSMTSILHGHLRGLTLRPNGGLYWLHKQHEETWGKIAHAVERSGNSSDSNKVYILRMPADPDTARAVRDSIRNEITQACDVILQELKDPELKIGRKGWETRKEACKEMAEKLKDYEKILNSTLVDVRQAVNKAYTGAVRSGIAQAGAKDEAPEMAGAC